MHCWYSEDASRSGLPADELLTGAPPNTAKPSKLTHSGSKKEKKKHGITGEMMLPVETSRQALNYIHFNRK